MSSSISYPTKGAQDLNIESSSKESDHGLLSPPATPPSKRSAQLVSTTKSAPLRQDVLWSHPALAKAYYEFSNEVCRFSQGVDATGELVAVVFRVSLTL